MASPENAPVTPLTSSALAVPMPCEATPNAMPTARSSFTLNSLSKPVPAMAPIIPVTITAAYGSTCLVQSLVLVRCNPTDRADNALHFLQISLYKDLVDVV